MNHIASQQIDDIEDTIDMVDLVNAAATIYPSVAHQSGVSLCAEDVLSEIACNRHPNESVARFRDNPTAFTNSGDMVEFGPLSAGSFAVLVSALEAVASAGHALDVLSNKRR